MRFEASRIGWVKEAHNLNPHGFQKFKTVSGAWLSRLRFCDASARMRRVSWKCLRERGGHTTSKKRDNSWSSDLHLSPECLNTLDAIVFGTFEAPCVFRLFLFAGRWLGMNHRTEIEVGEE